MSEPIVLGIESTCDETAAAIVQGRTLRSNVVASSMEEHARYGGVIPENRLSRARRGVRAVRVPGALRRRLGLGDVDAIAVSAGPGLAGCLAVGVSGAKALAWAANKRCTASIMSSGISPSRSCNSGRFLRIRWR